MVYINNIAVFLPHDPVGNDQMEAILGAVPGAISRSRRIVLRSNGIQQRYYAIDPSTGKPTHTNAQLAAVAARKLLERSSPAHGKIALLACGTSSPDQLTPAHGVMVHGELGIPPCEVVSMAGVCGSGVGALKYAFLSIKDNPELESIVTGSEITSKYLRGANFLIGERADQAILDGDLKFGFDQYFLRWMLSDGAAALLVQGWPKPDGLSFRIDWIDAISYANEQPACMYAGCAKQGDGSLLSWLDHDRSLLSSSSIMNLSQDVKQLNANIVAYAVEKPLTELIKKRRLTPEGIDFFVPHYSSAYFQPKLLEELQRIGFALSCDKWFTSLEQKGNVGSASIFISLDDLMASGRLRAGQTILCMVPESSRFSATYFHLTVVDGHEGI